MPPSPTKQMGGLGLSIRIDTSGVYGSHLGHPQLFSHSSTAHPHPGHLTQPNSPTTTPSSPLSARSSSSHPSSPSSITRRSKRLPYIDQACDFCRRRKKRCHTDDSQPTAADGQPASCVQCAIARRPCTRSTPQSNEAKKKQRGKWLTVDKPPREDGLPSPLAISSPTRSFSGDADSRSRRHVSEQPPRFLSVSSSPWARSTSESPSLASPLSSSMSVFSSSPSVYSNHLGSPSWHSSASSTSSSTPVSPCPSSSSAMSTSERAGAVSPLLLPSHEREWGPPPLPSFHLPSSSQQPLSPTSSSIFAEDDSDQPGGILLPMGGWPQLKDSRSPSPPLFDGPSLMLFDPSHSLKREGDDEELLPSLAEEDALHDMRLHDIDEQKGLTMALRSSHSADSISAQWAHSMGVDVDELPSLPEVKSFPSPISSPPFSELSSSSSASSDGLSISLSRASPDAPLTSAYLTAFFSPSNTGWSTLLEESAFRAEYDSVHGLHAGAATMDVVWQLCMGVVMAVGARIKGDVDYSRYAASLAGEAAAYIAQAAEPSAPGLSSHLAASFSAERLSLAVRSLLLLAHYRAAMCEEYTEQLTAASKLLSTPAVAALVPAEVQLMARMLPHLDAAMALPNVDASPASVESSPASPQAAALQEELLQQGSAYPLDQWRYLKLKRQLQGQLGVDEDDEELKQGREWDSFLDISAIANSPVSRAEILSIAACLAEAAAQAGGSGGRLRFSVFNCLTVLLRAEASVLPWPERGEVLGLKAACYQLLGKTGLAVKTAQAMLELAAAWRSSLPLCHSTLGLAFVRSLLILAELDVGRTSASLICSALTTAEALARSWPRLAAVHPDWHRVVLQWSELQVALHEERLRGCRQSLETEVLTALNQSMNELLTSAANRFLHQTSVLDDAKHKHTTLQQLSTAKNAQSHFTRRASQGTPSYHESGAPPMIRAKSA